MVVNSAALSPGRRAPNDNISAFLLDLVPGHLDGTDRYLDVITWNIRYFNFRDPERVEVMTRILQEINADVFVFQEVENSSLNESAQNLIRSGAGLYAAEYGTTGGRNRMAFLIDTEWVRNTTELAELFTGEPTLIPETSKCFFPRLPLAGDFIVRSSGGSFNLDIVGIHLKSSRTSAHADAGVEQRRLAATRLSRWLRNETSGQDIVVTGDWNATQDAAEWDSLRDVEHSGALHLGAWSDHDELSHVIQRRTSHIDSIVVSPGGPEAPVTTEVEGLKTTVLGWRDEMLSKTLIRQLHDKVSSDLPVLCRLVFAKSS